MDLATEESDSLLAVVCLDTTDSALTSNVRLLEVRQALSVVGCPAAEAVRRPPCCRMRVCSGMPAPTPAKCAGACRLLLV